jgi:uncharacterized damage-inducible protein DinB
MNDVDAILEGLERTPTILRGLLSRIPAEDLKMRRLEGKWSIHEHACHIADVQPMIIDRFQTFIEESKPVFRPYLPGTTDIDHHLMELDLQEMLSKFDGYRAELLDMVGGFSTLQLEKKGYHLEYKEFTPHIFLRHVLMHEHSHMYRIEALWLTEDKYL